MMPERNEIEKPDRKRSNLQLIAGELIDALKQSQMPPTRIADLLNSFFKNYNGDAVVLNQILGRRTVVAPDEIKPSSDDSDVTTKELMAIANRLWGKDGNIRPTEIFVQTHLQIDVHGYQTKPDVMAALQHPAMAKRLRAAVAEELRLREQCPAYGRFSRAFCLLSKRTQRKRHPADIGALTGESLKELGTEWFGNAHAVAGLAQLFGWDRKYIDEITNIKKAMPGELADAVANMMSCLVDVDLDAPKFVEMVQSNVKNFKRD